MGRFKPTLVQRLLRVVEHEAFQPPKAWSVLTRYRPAELSLQNRKPPAMEFTHNRLYARLFQAYPEVRMAPYALNLPYPSLARRFVNHQLALMRRGVARDAAFKQTEAAMRQQLSALKHENAAGGFMGYIQSQEEEALQGAMRTLKRRAAMAGGKP